MIKLRKANRHEKKDYPNTIATITIGKHEAQLTQKDIDLLQDKLNKFSAKNRLSKDELSGLNDIYCKLWCESYYNCLSEETRKFAKLLVDKMSQLNKTMKFKL